MTTPTHDPNALLSRSLSTDELPDQRRSMHLLALARGGDLHPRSTAELLQQLALIATNKIRDLHDRQRARKRDVALEVPIHGDPIALDGPTQPAVGGAPPDQQALLNDVGELVDDGIAQLPEVQRRVVILRDYCGEEWEHIAAELDRDNSASRQLQQGAWIGLRRASRPKLVGHTWKLDSRNKR